MALGTPTHLAAAFAGTSTLAQTISSITASIGDLVYVTTGDDGAGSNYAVTDSAGNTYTKLGTQQQLADNYNLWEFYSVLTSALSAGTITATKSGGSAGVWDRYVSAEKLTGTSIVLDKTAQATGTGTAWSSGSTAVTTASAEVVFGSAMAGGLPGTASVSTPGGGATELYDSGASSAFADLVVQYLVVAATGAQSSAGTWQASDAWAASAWTFKESAGGGAAVPRLLGTLGAGR